MTGKWLCDVCKKRTFETIEEATDHEASCKIHPFFQPKQQQRSSAKAVVDAAKRRKKTPADTKQQTNKPTHPFFQQTSKKTKKSDTNVPIAIGVEGFDEANLLDQQRALDFFSKQRKTQPVSKKQSAPVKRRKGKSAPRFPVPNHIIPLETNASSSTAVIPTLPQRCQTHVVDTVLSEQSDSSKTMWTDTSGTISTEPDVLLHQAIAHAMTVPAAVGGSLVDRHYYHKTSSPRFAQQELEAFIERFKIERLQAQTRRKERHDLRQGIRKPKRKTKKRKVDLDDDDDLWEDDDDDQVKTTLCLLTGPSGCGKSSMVYNVASRMECKSVLELHPGELRSGAQLRKFMEEATKSHSTRDMLREKNALFTQRQQLVDSDSEEDESGKKGVAVTIILLDEVDTLFEADAGFWPALSELAKTSKSPIVLTANTIPNGLKSAYTHIHLDRPSVPDCASRLIEIANAEGFKVHGNMEGVAILGNCDLRRILHTFQLFAMAPTTVEATTDATSQDVVKSRIHTIEDSAPVVERVEPPSIMADEITCLTVYGRNFNSLVHKSCREVEVMVGDQVCPYAQVVNDTTIQTVCPPTRLPSAVDCHGYYRGTRHRSLAVAHPDVIVRARPRQGVSSSDATIVASVVGKDKKVLVKPRPACLDIQFHGFTKGDIESDEEETEMEFSTTTASPVSSTEVPASTDPELVKKCLLLFKQALAEREESTVLESPMDECTDPSCSEEAEVLNDVSFDCQLASDAAFLRDVGLQSAPFLSGPCKGFGFTMTDEYPKRTNENSQPYVFASTRCGSPIVLSRPRFQRMFTENWNEDRFFFGSSNAYVQLPNRQHAEYDYLHRTERTARGSLLDSKCTDVYEDDEVYEHYSDAEDMFLHKPVSGSLLSLPLHLMNSLCTWTPPSWLQVSVSDVNRERARSQSLHFLTDMVYASGAQTRLWYDISNRCSETISNAYELRQQRYFLDHLPMIRCNVLSETAMPADVDDTLGGRRSRRRVRRPTFIEGLVPLYLRREDPYAFQEAISHLLATALHQVP